MSEWFEEWFESPEYLKVYKNRNDNDAWQLVSFICSKLSLKSGLKILDLACGAGRHAILLAGRGFQVTGVDLSKNLLNVARKNAEELKLNLSFIHSDIRNFLHYEKFDLVVNLFTSFGYFKKDEENFVVFKKASEMLKPEGFFAFDYLNSEYLKENLVPYSYEETDSYRVEQFRSIIDCRVEKKIVINNGNESKNFIESVKLYTPADLEFQLKKFGFDKIGLYGDYKGTIFDEKKSQRFLAICQKQ